MTSSAPPPPDQPEAPPPAAPPPADTPPAAPPPAAPPPAAAPEYSPPPAAPPSLQATTRPGIVTGAAVTMIVIGALICLFGVIALIAAAFVGGAARTIDSQAPGFGALAGGVVGVVIVFGLIFLAIGILDILAGANVLGGRGWARITGIVLAAIIGLFSLPSIFNGGGASGTGGGGGGIIVGLILLAANAFIIWALATTGPWFAARNT